MLHSCGYILYMYLLSNQLRPQINSFTMMTVLMRTINIPFLTTLGFCVSRFSIYPYFYVLEVSHYILWLHCTLFSSVQLFCIHADAVILKTTLNYEECRLLVCDAVWVYYKPTFRRNMSPPSSGYK
jgi:hypothetical protein